MNLIAWQKSLDLAEFVYQITEAFPRREIFGITAQVRRSAVSAPSNIAEGYGRMSTGELRQFLGTARGSLLETQTQLILSNRLHFGDPAQLARGISMCEETGRILNGLIESTYRRSAQKPRRFDT